jgi:MarR family transcriptional regulator for hemolysin
MTGTSSDCSQAVETPDWVVPPAGDAADPLVLARFLFVSRLFQVSRRWHNQATSDLREMPGIRGGWRTLFWISIVGRSATQRELAHRVGLDESTLARALDKLEKQGLVTRTVDPEDRRVRRIALTPAAAPALDRIVTAARQIRAELLDDVDPADLDRCLKVFDQIVAGLDKREAAAGQRNQA